MEEALPGGADDADSGEAAEIRRLIEAGASSPEELRALAARLREQREREEARWRSEVRPGLRKQGRRRRQDDEPPAVPPALGMWPPASPPPSTEAAPGDPAAPPPAPPAWPASPPATSSPVPPGPAVPYPTGPVPTPSRPLWVGVGLLVMAGLALVAASTTVWLLVLPVLALLGWAWVQGRRGPDG